MERLAQLAGAVEYIDCINSVCLCFMAYQTLYVI